MRRSSVASACPADGPIGALIITISVGLAIVLVATFSVAILMLSSLVGTYSPGLLSGSTPVQVGSSIYQPEQTSSTPQIIAYLLFFLLFGVCVLLCACGIGIRRGSQKSISLAIVLFGLGATTGTGLALLSLAICIYCVLRKVELLGSRKPPSEVMERESA
jgi:hypothetical protein